MTRTVSSDGSELAVLPVREAVLFPGSVLPLTVGRGASRRLVESLGEGSKLIVAMTQRDPSIETPGPNDLYEVGTAALVHRVVRMADHTYLIFVEGVSRVRVRNFIQLEPFMRALVDPLADSLPIGEDYEMKGLERSVAKMFAEIVAQSPNISDELQTVVQGIEDPVRLADLVAAHLPSLNTPTRQQMLETLDVRERLATLNAALARERQILEVRNRIESQVETQMGQSQREYLLREQMKAIQKELGDADDTVKEIEDLRKRIDDAGMPEEVRRDVLRELTRLEKMPPAAAEYGMARTYLDWLVSLPWSKTTSEDVDVERARAILDQDHYDLEKVKDRILDYLAVLRLRKDMKGPILCFVGPPGVGKTSLGRSIARALGRKFVRISLGGMHDEAEIRGHRRTYIGALPGQVIQGLRRAETRDPVFMLDEIDKIGRDFRGDPAAALLEVLDPEQNNTFRDHYLDVPFDLSRVLFITTANVLDPVPPALLDRMEAIELAGYTAEEKVFIAQRFLVPRQAEAHGLAKEQIIFEEQAIDSIVHEFTHEAGVRNLERQIAAICRKQARRLAQGSAEPLRVGASVVREVLGVPRYRLETELDERTRRPGVAVALAWTPQGGDILFVEAARMPRTGDGRGELTVTGQIGEVMQESMRAALAWVRANGETLGVAPDTFMAYDLHIHVPAGAIAKDGPSAGVTIVAALLSLLTDRPLPAFTAMTGEITLSGLVLPVGGIKEKVLAAKRSGIRRIILPKENEAHLLADVPPHLREGIHFQFVRTIDDLAELVLPSVSLEPAQPPQPEPPELHH
jgi:ATP-dependent Lon protease